MLLFKKRKDGGPESTVTGYWLIEAKSLFSVVLLKFEGKSREAYHTHAFNAISWLFKGCLIEHYHGAQFPTFHLPSFRPIRTPAHVCHKVDSNETSWVLSFRGPWSDTWVEHRPGETVTLTHGRKEL